MFKAVITALIIAAVLLAVPLTHAQTPSAQVTGSIAYRERMALPADAVIDVLLVDTSVADIAAQTVAESMINAEGRQVPVSFTLSYDPALIVPAHRYSVRATIRSGDGMLMFSTTQAYPVLTHGAPSKVSLVLHTVGHGIKPSVAAKKPSTTTESSQVEQVPAPAEPKAEAAAETKLPAATAEAAPAATAPPSTPEPVASQPSVATVPQEVPPAPEGKSPASESANNSAKASEPQPQFQAAEPSPNPAVPPASSTGTETAAPQSPPATPNTASAVIAESAPPKSLESQPASPEPAVSATVESKPAEPEPPKPTEPEPAPPKPTGSVPESKPAEPEPSLPEAPSASKGIAPPRPDTATEPESESSSRPERPRPNKGLTPLADTQWRLIELGGEEMIITPPQKPVTLAFSPEGLRIAGSAGCNSYLGTFNDDHGLIHLNPGNLTMMHCADPAGSREKKFVAMLRSADGYKIDGDFLLLKSNGKTVAKFKTNPPL
jgi:putative lipoprotein